MFKTRIIAWALFIGAGAFALVAIAIATTWIALLAASTDHDSYYVIPSPISGVLVFAIGLAVYLVGRTTVWSRDGRLLWVQRSHLLGTTLLLIFWMVVHALLRTGAQSHAELLSTTLSAMLVLMLLAHAGAMMVAGMRVSTPGPHGESRSGMA